MIELSEVEKLCPICKEIVYPQEEAISLDIQHWGKSETSEPTDLALIIIHEDCLKP